MSLLDPDTLAPSIGTLGYGTSLRSAPRDRQERLRHVTHRFDFSSPVHPLQKSILSPSDGWLERKIL